MKIRKIGGILHFIKTDSPLAAIQQSTRRIADALSAGQHVLWLISGGSIIPVEIAIMQKLHHDSHLENLKIMQVDERYGKPGHPDSNWQRLLEAGFAAHGAVCLPILTGASFDASVGDYAQALAAALDSSDLRIGMFGIGTDGHTAGMLPGSLAAQETTATGVGYQSPDFLRITMTAPAIAELDVAIVYAIGIEKHSALDNLQRDLPVSQQPAQALKNVATALVYNDYMGETA